MKLMLRYAAAAAVLGGIAAPAMAQTPYPYPQYPQQTYPQYPQGYPQQGYPQQGQNPIQSIIDQLLGNRYNVDDRTAVQRCATAVMAQANARYGSRAYGQGYNQYGQPYGQQQYGQGYAANARITAITNVERRSNGLRVTGTLDSGRYAAYGNQGYGQGYGYGNQGYGYGNPNQAYVAQTGDLTFRCNVDYRGAVSNIRLTPNRAYRRY